MKAEFINPVVDAATYVLKQTCSIEITVGKPYLTQTVYDERVLVVMIGLTGELQGQIILGMVESVACDIASKMMMGFPIDDLNDMAKSALGELMNMTMGNAVTEFSHQGVTLDITPPTMFVSNNLKLVVGDSRMICVPITYEQDKLIELNIAIKEK